MEQRTYTVIELVGVSEYTYDDAARRAIARASESREGHGWFKVEELRGSIQDGEVAEYQVALQLGLSLVPQAEHPESQP